MDKQEESDVAAKALAPEVITVRFNAFSPTERMSGPTHPQLSVPVVRESKPLGQGLLLAATNSTRTHPLRPGDHRAPPRWFTPRRVHDSTTRSARFWTNSVVRREMPLQ